MNKQRNHFTNSRRYIIWSMVIWPSLMVALSHIIIFVLTYFSIVMQYHEADCNVHSGVTPSNKIYNSQFISDKYFTCSSSFILLPSSSWWPSTTMMTIMVNEDHDSDRHGGHGLQVWCWMGSTWWEHCATNSRPAPSVIPSWHFSRLPPAHPWPAPCLPPTSHLP